MTEPLRLRREPPRWRAVELLERVHKTSRLVRLTLRGDEIDGDLVREPAASVRLLLPDAHSGTLVVPEWSGNEFLLPDGRRPTIRTLTPLAALDADPHVLAVEVVVHGDSPLSTWATAAPIGAGAAVSGPGRGYVIDSGAPAFVLAGDETARPAIEQLLPLLPTSADVEAIVIDDPDELPDRVAELDFSDGARVWVAGEAAAMQRIRKHLFEERGLPRAHCTVRGYWKRGRAGAGDD